MGRPQVKQVIFYFEYLHYQLKRVNLIVLVQFLMQKFVADVVEEQVLAGAALVKVIEVLVVLLYLVAFFDSQLH